MGIHFRLFEAVGRRRHIQSLRGAFALFSEDFSSSSLEKMICRILLLISLNCVCGTFVVNVTQTSYQAEENHNITLEWMFTTTIDASPSSLYIFCEMITDHTGSVLFHLRAGVEVPESQDQQFVGRVQCDKDVLRDGRLRLHVSRLRTEDSGLYTCDVRTNYGVDFGECRLNVSAARDWSEPERPNTDTPERPNTDTPERPNTDTPEGLKWPIWGMIAFFSVVGLAVVVVSVIYLLNIHFLSVHKILPQTPVEDLRKVTAQQKQKKQFDHHLNETLGQTT